MFNPVEGWDCTNFLGSTYGSFGGNDGESAHIFHETVISATHPFLSQIWNGSCDEGQLTAGGLRDAIAHGKVVIPSDSHCLLIDNESQDFASVYVHRLKFLKDVNPTDIWVRTSTEDRTYQVAGGLLYGVDASVDQKVFKVHNQPAAVNLNGPVDSSLQAHRQITRLTPWYPRIHVPMLMLSGISISPSRHGLIISIKMQT